MPPSDLNRDPATGMRMGEKLRTYFLGFALGLAMVVLMLMARWQMKAQDKARREAQLGGTVQPATGIDPQKATLPTGPR